ncbi:MAG: SMP-30/gluconolactonase/LRE family protein [Gemmatimonadaceae bacterium]
MMIRALVSVAHALGITIAAVGCTRGEAALDLESTNSSRPHRVLTILGARDPESVRYDPDQDAYFISMMNGFGSVKDNNGYIVRVPAGEPSQLTMFAESGKNGVTLNAPKGMAIHGDTLWVADIDVLRGFDRRSGAPVATIDFAAQRPTLLNDVALGPDGRIYVTDTGIQMTEFGVIYAGGDRVFAVGPRRSISVIAEGSRLGRPNGITWDGRGKRWLVVTFDPFSSTLYTLREGDTARTVLARGKGKWDGVEALADGRILVSSWSDSSVHILGADGKQTAQVIRPVPEPADIGVDTRRGQVAVPVSVMGRVEVWGVAPR